MTLYESMQDLVGETPLIHLRNMGFPGRVNVYAKLELWNPSGSVKDRTAECMIRDACSKELLKDGGTIVEATAGNMGMGIAFNALNRGFRVVFVVPSKFSAEKLTLMRALGAEIVVTPHEDGMLGAERRAEELLEEIPGSVSLRQFRNASNPAAHFESTGPEIFRDLGGKVDYAVMGAGSGGTFTGIVGYLKGMDPHVEGVLADPVGSLIGGGEKHEYRIEGIGNDFIADTMDMTLVDRVIKVTDDEAVDECRRLASHEGIFAGSSSGAALAAVRKLSETVEGNIVTVLPDRGDRYFSEHLYERGWGAWGHWQGRRRRRGARLYNMTLWPRP